MEKREELIEHVVSGELWPQPDPSGSSAAKWLKGNPLEKVAE